MSYDAKTYSRRYYEGDGSPKKNVCGLCGERKPVEGDVLCKGCQAQFDDEDVNLAPVADYERRIATERKADKDALDKAKAGKKEG